MNERINKTKDFTFFRGFLQKPTSINSNSNYLDLFREENNININIKKQLPLGKNRSKIVFLSSDK